MKGHCRYTELIEKNWEKLNIGSAYFEKSEADLDFQVNKIDQGIE